MANYKIQLKDAQGNLYYPNVLNGESLPGGESLPIGSMLPYSSEVIPNGFLPCDGSEVSRNEYKELFAVIGITYGAGDGETTFNLPDKRGRLSAGLDLNQEEFNSIGLKGGEKEHTLTIDEMPSHTHTYTRSRLFYAEEAGQNAIGYGSNAGTAITAGTNATGGDKPHNNLQPYEVDQWIIKAFNGSYSQPVSGDVNDTLPVGSIIEFDGDYIPDGYEEVEDYEHTYSFVEKRIGTWADKKPLYQKVVQYTLTATDGYPSFDTGIRDIDYAMLEVYKSDSGNTNTDYFRIAQAISGYLSKSNGLFTFILVSDAGVFKAQPGLYTFIIKYTKITD